ncbi:hypothetical protein M2165_002513 [Variovorax sp. TBS-050B]|uniref:hypothetical protein n=1 Tax=Variovorax sp. TBS-050B TaxID=2940551 RepID=UPI002473EDBA|nr:hypothetical protein [Variovorax sp. TBS-050B]MDH6592624.1 hypothetical protein [Variovorax sp. TBS-050B]
MPIVTAPSEPQRLVALLLAALEAAPRRFRMPALPADAAAAAAAGDAATALAFAIDAARRADETHAPPPADAQVLFTQALARLIEEALAPDAGDPAFQAALMLAEDAAVAEHVRLAAQRAADLRAVRAAVDAIAHPGKLRPVPAGASRDALAQLHALSLAGEWAQLAQAIARQQPALGKLAWDAALQRLVRGDALLQLANVQRYRTLAQRRGPPAGSDAAAARGRAAASEGAQAERVCVEALRDIAQMLNHGDSGFSVVRGLRTPRGFPGIASKAKEEWDAAIVRHLGRSDGALELVLLAEIKASPAAATSDLPRLLRGLRRLAEADAETAYAFGSTDGEVRLLGSALRGLRPIGHALPPRVIYCCAAATEPRPPALLSAATRTVLLAEPASRAHAQRLARDEAPPPHESLLPVWQALVTAPRLRAALHQYETACTAREAMLHPDDLRAAVLGRAGGG